MLGMRDKTSKDGSLTVDWILEISENRLKLKQVRVKKHGQINCLQPNFWSNR
jgi:hypothetical protein